MVKIFIVGTGRCGTTILNQALGCHRDIHAFPFEMRFLVDPNGLIDLIDALTVRFSPVKAREVLYRFERLMRIDLANPHRPPYLGMDLPRLIGEDFYWKRLNRFCSRLAKREFPGTSWEVDPFNEGPLQWSARSLEKLLCRCFDLALPRRRWDYQRTTLKLVDYVQDRSSLTKLAAGFVDDLFLHAANRHGKSAWSEMTPYHLLHLDFIYELFPEGLVIHIKRDPRGVVHSLLRQNWAPNDLDGAIVFLRSQYERWFAIKQTLNLTERRYMEIKLEDLAASPTATLANLAEFCHLGNHFDNLPDIRTDRVDYWQEAMPPTDKYRVEEQLLPYFAQMGYRPPG